MKYRTVCAMTLLLVVFSISCGKQSKADLSKGDATPGSAISSLRTGKWNSAGFLSSLEAKKAGPWFGGAANVVFRSIDGGQTWKDVSAGLPINLQWDSFFADEQGLYLSGEKGLYHTEPSFTLPFWTQEDFPRGHRDIAPGKRGMYAFNYNGPFIQKTRGPVVWSPVYPSFSGHQVRTIFESDGGAVFIGNDNGLFKSTDNGNTWKHVHKGGWVIKLVESRGVLMATNQKGIIRSADDGESWELVISEGGVGIDVEVINEGFAATSCSTALKARSVRTSNDGGKTWQPVDYYLPADANASISSIIGVDDFFFCGHPDGIFRSADHGRTWNLMLPSIEGKVFSLCAIGKVIYALPKDGGC